MGLADFFTAGPGTPGGFSLPPITAFSIPSFAGAGAGTGITLGTQDKAKQYGEVSPNLLLWNRNQHDIINTLLGKPAPTATDIQKAIDDITKNTTDLLTYIDKKVTDQTLNKQLHDIVQGNTDDIQSQLQALRNKFGGSPLTSVAGSSNLIWYILGFILLVALGVALEKRKK